jgi:hypothetical protein
MATGKGWGLASARMIGCEKPRSAFPASESLERSLLPPPSSRKRRFFWGSMAVFAAAGLLASGCFKTDEFIFVQPKGGQPKTATADQPAATPAVGTEAPASVPQPRRRLSDQPSAAAMQQSAGPLRQSHSALQAHHDQGSGYPLTGSELPEAKQKLSWRVMVLPYLDPGLFQQIDRQQAWNSEANSRLHAQMPAAYRSPHRNNGDHKTVILAPVTPRQERGNTVLQAEPIFDDRAPVYANPPYNRGRNSRMTDVTDGTFNTVLLVEADASEAAEWMRPADLAFDPAQPKRGLGHLIPGGFCAVFVNGEVRFVSNKVDDKVLAIMMRRDDQQSYSRDDTTTLVGQ